MLFLTCPKNKALPPDEDRVYLCTRCGKSYPLDNKACPWCRHSGRIKCAWDVAAKAMVQEMFSSPIAEIKFMDLVAVETIKQEEKRR